MRTSIFKLPTIIIGERVSGFKIARSIGIPTINVKIKDYSLKGVYFIKIKKYYGICFCNMKNEIYLIDFSKEKFYSDSKIHITFIKKIREIKHFDTLKNFKKQAKIDIIKAKEIYDKCSY